MSFSSLIRDICATEDAHELPQGEAHQLFAAMLDGGVPELELGALLVALERRQATVAELAAYHGAVHERLYRLAPPSRGLRPVVIPAYGGGRSHPDLLPLLALLLKRFGVPVLVHGMLESLGPANAAHTLRELGILPVASLTQAQRTLYEEGLVFVPTRLLSPGLAELLRVGVRLGLQGVPLTLAGLLDPHADESLRLVHKGGHESGERLHEFLCLTNACALLLQGADGQPVANALQRPRIELFTGGRGQVLFEAEPAASRNLVGLPVGIDARTMARWTERVLGREIALPLPIVNQLACCLYACGALPDLNQAKAVVAVETGSLASS